MIKQQFKIVFIPVFIFLCSFVRCSSKSQYLNIPLEIMPKCEQKKLFHNNNLCLVCYFDGSCSFCYADVLSIEKSYYDITRLYISYGKDTLMINANISQLNIENTNFIHDVSQSFYTKNETIFPNHIFLIDSTFAVLGLGTNFDDKLKNEIRNRKKTK